MSIALIVDAACDLPQSFLQERNITLLPTSIRVDDIIYTDDKDPQKLQDFYSKGLLTKDHSAESIAYTAEQIADLIVNQIVPHYDFAFLQTVSRKKSLIHENSQQASYAVMRRVREARTNQASVPNFAMRVLNSGTLFCGQGILAAYTSDLIRTGKSKHEILSLTKQMCDHIHAFIVPPSVDYVRARARKKGEDSVGFLTAVIARSLDIVPIITGRNDATESAAKIRGFEHAVNVLFKHAIHYLEADLLAPYIIVSIAGDLTTLTQLKGFKALQHQAKLRKVHVLPCVMGLTSGLNVGPGSVGMGFLAKDRNILFES